MDIGLIPGTLDIGLLLVMLAEMLKEILGGVWRRLPRRLKRWTMSASQAHFAVTAGAIITDERGRVLLLKHRFRPGSGWGIPGGYIEKGEQPEDALRRELREEAGLELGSVALMTVRTFKKPQQVEIIFVCRPAGAPDQLNYEILKAQWFSVNELPPSLPKDQAKLIKQALDHGAQTQD